MGWFFIGKNMKKILLATFFIFTQYSAQASEPGTNWQIKSENKRVGYVPNASLVANMKYTKLFSQNTEKTICVPSSEDILGFVRQDMEENNCFSSYKKEGPVEIIEYTCKYEDSFTSKIVLKPTKDGYQGKLYNSFIHKEKFTDVDGTVSIINTKQPCETN